MPKFEGAVGVWVSVEKGLPVFRVPVLVITEQQQMNICVGDEEEVWPEDPYYYRLARLKPQFRTEKPFWVSAWDGELIEDVNLAVTHWMRLPLPPQEAK